MKKYLSALLVVLMIVSVFSSGATAYAEKGRPGDAEFTMDDAYARYDSAESFDHVDIRVAGTLTVDGEEKAITVSHPSVVIHPAKGDKPLYEFDEDDFDESSDYEWRKTKLNVPKDAEVVLTCDITVDGVTKTAQSFTFKGKEDFAKAIYDCDGNQGLDFIVEEEQIQEVFYYGVSYQWGELPEGLATLPVDENRYASGSTVAVDTSFKANDTVKDEKGNVYTFSGWKEYGPEEAVRALLTDTGFSITANTVVYGTWTMTAASTPSPTPSTDPEPEQNPNTDPSPAVPTGSLTIAKIFGTDSEIKADSENVGTFTFTITSADGSTKAIQLPIPNSDTPWEHTIALPVGSYTVTEDVTSAQRESYELVVNEAGEQDDAVTVDITDGGNIKATVTNTYSKKTGDDIIHPASFKVLKTDESGKALSGAEFTLYDRDGSVVSTVTTDAKGEAVFGGFSKAAEYTLKETKAPENYVASEQSWKVTVSLKEGDPSIQISEDGSLWNKVFNWTASADPNGVDGVLTVQNKLKTGSLTITNAVENNKKLGPEAEEYKFTLRIGEQQQSFTLKDGESKTFENLPYGTTYTVLEEVGDDASWNIKAPADGIAEGTIAQENQTVDFVNRYEYAAEPDMAVFSAVKQSSKDGKALAGAEFTVYSDKDCTKSVATATTDANGKLGFGFKSEGSFYMKETKAPSGYVCSNKVVELTVSLKQYAVEKVENADKSITLTIVPVMELKVKGADLLSGSSSVFQLVNDPESYVDLTVNVVWKGDKESGTRPEKVTVTLYKDGEKYESKTVTEKDKWSCTWKNLPSQYKWTVDESSLPKGYTKSISLKNNTFTITNTYSSIPKTGDESTPVLWALLALATASGAVLTVKKLRKENG